MTYQEIIEKVKSDQSFSFTRWGDGEWNCVLAPNDEKGNCDGHKYFASLSKGLRGVLLSKPEYLLGMQNFAMKIKGDAINQFISQNNLEDIKWINADVFHHASIAGKFDHFIDVLRGKNTILVGPAHLSTLKFYKRFIQIYSQDCWLQKDWIVNQVKEAIKEPSVVLFCASMAANVMIDELYRWNPHNTYLDMGSVFEPYAGKASRSYHKKILERING